MLTKKIWNTLSKETRKEIIEAIYGSASSHPHLNPLIDEPYNHNFDFNSLGTTLKNILSDCNLQKDGSINITVNIKPKYAEKPVKKSKAISEESKWYVDYETKDGDLCHVWVVAFTKEEAEEKALDEYHDIDEIISISKKN